MLNLKTCNVRWDKENFVPRIISNIETIPASGTSREIAEEFLKENKSVLKITAPLSDLRYERTVESLGGSTVLFQQYHKNMPINGAWIAVHIDKKNRIFMVKNDTIPVHRIEEKTSSRRGVAMQDDALETAISDKISEYGELDSEVFKEEMIYAKQGQIREVLKVKFSTRSPKKGSWILFFDRNTGALIEERDMLWKVDGRGRVFNPNPVVTLNRNDMIDHADANDKIFSKAYRTVVLRGLDQSGFLTGSYVDTGNTENRASSPSFVFKYTRADDRFEEVMAYYHIDSVQRYIQSLGFKDETGIFDHAIKVNAHGSPEDQSWFDPTNGKKDITFGSGGVDDAEDAEIIVHEYGHALMDAIIPGFGQSSEAEAIGEGFSDYLAGSFYAKKKKADRKVKIAEWDAKGYCEEGEVCLRRLDSQKHYPDDMTGECHEDGEIWSACLWKVRKLLGKVKADTVIIESIFYLNQYSDFRDGAETIIQAEKNLYGGKKTKGLEKIFRERGIL